MNRSGSANIPMKRLQGADKLLGLVACSALVPLRWWRRLRRPDRPGERVLLIKFWGIGSLQLLTPAEGVLRRRHPGANLTLLTLAENEAFARGLGLFDDVVTLDVSRGGWMRLARRILGLVGRLRRGRFDEVYDFEFFTRFSAVVAGLSGASELHGFHAPTVWRGGIHTRTVPFNRYWHVARNFRALAGGEDGAEVEPDDLSPYRVSARDESELERVLEELGVEGGSPLVVLNPNAGQLSLERRWPAERFAALARILADDEGATVAFIGSKSERSYTAGAVALAGADGAIVDLSGRLDVGALCALLERADLLVSNDSGPMHLAAGLGTPTIGLFGPETPVMYRPLGRQARALWRPPVCSPCINVHDNKVANCIHGRPECLMNIGVDEVVHEARRTLRDEILRPAARPAATSTPRVEAGS